jgi:hypothetical protein
MNLLGSVPRQPFFGWLKGVNLFDNYPRCLALEDLALFYLVILLWFSIFCVKSAGLFFDDFKYCRFAILSGPTIPIIGEGEQEANDR